jgi:hypothetical protein
LKPNFLKIGWHIFVLADEDQALAAEPGFHSDPPDGGGAGLMSIRRFSDHRSEPLVRQSKKGLSASRIAGTQRTANSMCLNAQPSQLALKKA